MALYMDLKSSKNITSIDFVNVNIALNSHAYEKNQQNFIIKFIERYVSFVAL